MTTSDAWLAGCAKTDITGEPWGTGMMGYGMPHQWSKGLATRQYARAFVFAHGTERVAYVVADIGMFFQGAVDEILARLAQQFGDRYTARNTVLSATHTHCGPGGHSTHMLYNITTHGFHRRTFERLVNGVVEAIAAADADLAPAELHLSQGELHTASVNRARLAFAQNPHEDQAPFPDGIDSLATLLRIEREGQLIGAVHWFAVHNTSLTNQNCLVHSDNKGLAALAWETENPGAVLAFAQTNAGDLSPNLDLRPGTGPTDDNWENARIIAARQIESAKNLATGGERIGAHIASTFEYVSMHNAATAAGRTGHAILGASFAAGKLTDGPGSPLFDEGKNNPIPQRISTALYRLFPRLRRAHAPKDLLIPLGRLGWGQQRFAIQIVQLGPLYLVCLPFEVTVVSGLRIRRKVARIIGAELSRVLVQGYANGYGHYVTTPEEYDVQRYEGGSTVFGRQQLAAIVESAARLATDLATARRRQPVSGPADRGSCCQVWQARHCWSAADPSAP